MPDISKITLPSGNTYDIKDAVAREAIASLSGGSYFLGVSETPITDQSSTSPIYVNGEYVYPVNGNMAIYGNKEFVWSTTQYLYYSKMLTSDTPPKYYYTVIANPTQAQKDAAVFTPSRAVPTTSGDAISEPLADGADIIKAQYSGKWVEFGDMSSLGALAYKDSVTLSKGSGDNVLGEGTTFTNASSSVSFAAHTTKNALGASASFTTSVTPTTTNLKATASGTAVNTSASDAFVKSYSPSSGTITLSVGGTGNETLQIGGTGFSSNTFTGLTALGTPTTGTAIGSITSVTQPTISLATGATAGTGVVSVATGITSSSTTVSSADTVAAITGLGAGTAAAQSITVGTNDKVKIAKYDDLSVSVS